MLHIQLYRARRDHARLGRLIELEQGSRRPDPFRLAALKKRKLAARDRISVLEAREADESVARPQTA